MKHALRWVGVAFGSAALASGCSGRGGHFLEAEFKKAVTESQRARPECERWRERLNALQRAFVSDPGADVWIPKDSGAADGVFELLKTFPGSDPSLHDFRLTLWGSTADVHALDRSILSGLYACSEIALLDAYKALIQFDRVHGLEKERKREIGKLAFTQAASELDRAGWSMITTLIYSYLTNELVRNLFVDLSDPLYLALASLETRGIDARERARFLWRAHPKDLNENWRQEVNAIMPISADLQRVVERISSTM
jgi:hypothetical protein